MNRRYYTKEQITNIRNEVLNDVRKKIEELKNWNDDCPFKRELLDLFGGEK